MEAHEILGSLSEGLLGLGLACAPALTAWMRDRFLPILVSFPLCLLLGLMGGQYAAAIGAGVLTVWAAQPRRVRVWNKPAA